MWGHMQGQVPGWNIDAQEFVPHLGGPPLGKGNVQMTGFMAHGGCPMPPPMQLCYGKGGWNWESKGAPPEFWKGGPPDTWKGSSIERWKGGPAVPWQSSSSSGIYEKFDDGQRPVASRRSFAAVWNLESKVYSDDFQLRRALADIDFEPSSLVRIPGVAGAFLLEFPEGYSAAGAALALDGLVGQRGPLRPQGGLEVRLAEWDPQEDAFKDGDVPLEIQHALPQAILAAGHQTNLRTSSLGDSKPVQQAYPNG